MRQRNDGKTLVYAVYKYNTAFADENSVVLRGGELLDVKPGETGPIVRVIERVGREMEGRIPEDAKYGRGIFPRLIHECIADLPAEQLDVVESSQ